MKSPLTPILLVIIAGLLTVHLLRAAPLRAADPASPLSATPAVLRAQRIELVDQHGQARMQFTIEDNGEAVLRIRDAKGTIRVKLGAAENGSALALLNDRTEPGVHLSARSDGTQLTLAETGKRAHIIAP